MVFFYSHRSGIQKGEHSFQKAFGILGMNPMTGGWNGDHARRGEMSADLHFIARCDITGPLAPHK